MPFVTFGRPWGAEPDAPERHGWVDVDGAQGTLAATRHLIDSGHQRIAFLGWPDGLEVGDDRRTGWASLLAVSGIDVPVGYDAGVPDGLDTGRKAAATMLDLPTPPTAIVCASDSLALGAWTEITARGLRPGVDVAVVGFDDSPTAAVVGLSSVAQPYDEAAAACLRMLQELLATPNRRPPRRPLSCCRPGSSSGRVAEPVRGTCTLSTLPNGAL